MKKKCLLPVILLIFYANLCAQVTVTITNPGNATPALGASYPSLANAVTAVNAITAMSGPVILTCAAGTETAPAGGYSINNPLGTSAANTITFNTSGAVTITASPVLTVGSLTDAIFKLIGADYITIEGFTLQENAANIIGATEGTNNMTEFGVALFHASTTNGAQNNTIQNNTISLDRTYSNTFGIYANSRHSATNISSANEAANNTTAPNSNNKIYGNIISNVNIGISFLGGDLSGNQDVNTDIGGNSAATGNTITNWGGTTALSNYRGNPALTSYCILVYNQTNENVSYNTIVSAAVSGTSVAFIGIRKDFSSQPVGTVTSTIANNTITMSSSFASGLFECILSQGMTALSTATININNNTILNCFAALSNFFGILNSSAPGVLNMNNNSILGTTSTATTGGFTGFRNSGAVITTVNINNNQLGDGISSPIDFTTPTSGTITGIQNSAGAATATVNINNNIIDSISCVSAGIITCITNTGATNATLNINDNSIINTVISGAGATDLTCITNVIAVSVLTINGNIIRSNTSAATTGDFTGIINSGNIVNTVTITNNQLGNAAGGAITYGVATSGSIQGINSGGSASTATANVSDNSIDGISLVTSGVFQAISNGGNAGTANINNNQLGSVTGTLVTFSGAQSSLFTGIVNNSSNASSVMTMQGNDISGIVHATAGSSQYQLLASNSPIASQTISSNTFTNLSLNTTGGVYFITRQGNMASGASWTCSNNSIVAGFTKGGAGNNVVCIYSVNSSVAGCTMTETGNIFTNISLASGTFFWGINNQEGASSVSAPAKTITGNIISNVIASGPVFGIQVDKGSSLDCFTNTISNITCSSSGDTYGIALGSNIGSGTVNVSFNTIAAMSTTLGDIYGIGGGSTLPSFINISDNTITGLSTGAANNDVTAIDLTSASTAEIHTNNINNLTGTGIGTTTANGIRISGGTAVYVYRNKINTILQSGAMSATSPVVNGILFSNGTTVMAYNNFIADLRATNANLTDAIRGISVTSTTASSTYSLYYNSIYINGNSAGTNFGTSGIFHTTNATATTAALDMIDNIIVNTSTPKGAGLTVAYRRSNATLANYGSASDYNLFYAGTPGATRLIYYDGTNSDQTLAAYRTRVSPRDANSLSVMPNFTSSTDLHLSATNNCAIDGAATPIVVLTDIDGVVRNSVTPDIGADEFNATYSGTLAGITGSAVCDTKNVSLTGTAYTTNACNLIARVLPSGASPVSGKINVCVRLETGTTFYNSEPYLLRHFDIEPVSYTSSTTARVTLYVLQNEFTDYNTNNGGFPDLPGGPADAAGIANLRITQYHGVWTSQPLPGYYPPGGAVLINPSDVDVVWNATNSYWEISFDITGFSGFFIHTTVNGAPLADKLISFNGRREGSMNLLNWKIANEQNIRGYEVQRSNDGQNFSPIGFVNSLAPGGSSNQPLQYSFRDNSFSGEKQYYRLKQVANNGQAAISSVVLIKGDPVLSLVVNNVFPNPASDVINISLEAPAKEQLIFSVADISGRVMIKRTVIIEKGTNIISLPVEVLAKGTYLLRVICDDGCENVVTKFVKQ